MKKLISLFISAVFLLLNSNVAFANINANLKLVWALDLVRHGDRTPSEYLPKISKAWTKEEIGKLTPRGAKQATLLGENFRNYYVDKTGLLPKEFDPNLVYVRSTDFQRTQKTAKSILSGMFSTQSSEINIFVPSTEQDIFNHRNKDHSVSKEVSKKISISNPAIAKHLKNINRIFGTKFSEPSYLREIANIIKVSTIHKKPLLKPLPEKTKKHILFLGEKLLMLKSFAHPQMACLYGGDSVLHIADLLKFKRRQKYFLYVAHDMNIMAITSLLNLNLEEVPPYLADLRFEIFQDKNYERFVRMSLDGKVIKICKSSDDCPLKEFVKTLKDNVENKCRVPA